MMTMPLSTSPDRMLVHHRTIDCQGYLRPDGNWDLDGHLKDTKGFALTSMHGREIAAGSPIHEMFLRLTVDAQLTILAVEATTDAAPHATCHDASPLYEALVGIRIARGYMSKFRERAPLHTLCTHVSALVEALGTVAFQTLGTRLPGTPRGQSLKVFGGTEEKPALLNTCRAHAQDSEVVKVLWPAAYRPGRPPVAGDKG